MATTFTRPTDPNGNTYEPNEYDPDLMQPRAIQSVSGGHTIQARDIGSTKRRWVEHYPVMSHTASVKTFLSNLQTWSNQATSLNVTERSTGDDSVITAKIASYSVAKGAGRFVRGLRIEFVEE